MSNTVDDARAQLFSQAEKGATCPCCDQFVKTYKRKLSSAMARALIYIYQRFEREDGWLHVPSYLATKTGNSATSRGGDWAKLVHWGLIEPMTGERDDGSRRNGYYKITERGRLFVRGEISIPAYVYLYNGGFLGFTDGNKYPLEFTTIQEAIGEHFNYAELMRG